MFHVSEVETKISGCEYWFGWLEWDNQIGKIYVNLIRKYEGEDR